MANIPEWVGVAGTVAQFTMVPLFLVLWKFQGRLSTIEGKLEIISSRR